MADLPPSVYGPIGLSLVGAITALWKAWRSEAEKRASERQAEIDWKNNLLNEVLAKEDK